ncbi:hypothetical protein N657DRAFT_623677 [Parathielavia appendiculata]|uniref:Uncharacterized protein n=1 Tax=Parathielavia appendiculata TaxID=2587402 RepID=A0AAN6Z0T3_9PEZI|nr:hypothetical protein N657DRAFT_623677 [Parathielavia appendiculata]
MSQSKADKIETVKSNLPLPENPPVKSDFNSADTKTTAAAGVSAGDVSTGPGVTSGLREPATKGSDETDMSKIGRQGKEGLEETPKDARR